MTSSALKLQPSPRKQVSRLDHLHSLIEPEYMVDTFIPERGNLAFYPACRAAQGRCMQPGMLHTGLCTTHAKRLKEALGNKAKPTPTEVLAFIEDPEASGQQRQHVPDMSIHLGPLHPEARAELQLFIQICDRDKAFTAVQTLKKLVEQLAELKVQSIFERSSTSEDQIVADHVAMPDAEWVVENNENVKVLLRRCMRQVAYAASRLPLSERNSWRPEDLGLAAVPGGSKSTTIVLSYQLPWLKAAAARHMSNQVLMKQSARSTMVNRNLSLRKLDDYLCTLPEHVRPQGMGDLRREHLEGFIGYMRSPQAKITGRRLGEILSGVRQFLDQWRDLGWEPRLADGVVLRLREARTIIEVPLPKPLEPDALRQLMDPTFTSGLSPWLRRMLIIARHHGLRPSSLVTLPLECLRYNGSDKSLPVLRYMNVKGRRETEQPIERADVIQAIEEQKRDVLARWPQGSPWLFPSPLRNPDGTLVLTGNSIRLSLQQAVGKAGLTTATGAPLQITWYNFRDTVATELLNRGLPPAQVAAWLDHSDLSSLDHYCRLHAETLRKSIDEAPALDIHGRDLKDAYAQGANRDIEALRMLMKSGTTNIQGGVCMLPVRETCDHHMKCLSCENFATSPVNLPEHLQHLQQANMMAVVHETAGKVRQAERERLVAAEVRPIVKMLHEWTQQHPEDVASLSPWLQEHEHEIREALKEGDDARK